MHYHQFKWILKKVSYDEYLTELLPEISYDIGVSIRLRPHFKDKDQNKWIELKDIGDIEECIKYNDKVEEYNRKHPDENIKYFDLDNCTKFPALINDKIVECEEFFYYIIANSYGEFHIAFNRSVLDYFTLQLNNARNLELDGDSINDIQEKINTIKRWFVNNNLIPKEMDTFIDNFKTKTKISTKKNKGGRPSDPNIVKKREGLYLDYYNLTEKKGLKKAEALKQLSKKYNWAVSTIDKYIKG